MQAKKFLELSLLVVVMVLLMARSSLAPGMSDLAVNLLRGASFGLFIVLLVRQFWDTGRPALFFVFAAALGFAVPSEEILPAASLVGGKFLSTAEVGWFFLVKVIPLLAFGFLIQEIAKQKG
ncbi:MAG: hypothetical protein ACM3TT_04455 [Syntrophothermus sp.]